MTRRIVSLWLPRLATDLIARRAPRWREQPLALYWESGQRLQVMAVNAAAEAEGILPGMTLADARALFAGLGAQVYRQKRQARALLSLARWLDRFSPAVAIDGQDGLFLDATGVAHLFGGEAAYLARIKTAIAGFGFIVRAAMAATPGAAWAYARYGEDGACIAGRDARAALAPLPVAALRLEAGTTRQLMRLGLSRIEALYALPRQALARRFGLRAATRLDQALGAAPEPLAPARPPAPYAVRLAFEEPIGERVSIEAALDRLTALLIDKLKRHGRGARRLMLTTRRVDGGEQTLTVGMADPTRDADRLARLFREKLDDIDPGFGIEAIRLAAAETGPLESRQADALGEATAGPDALAQLIDALGNRLGFDAIRRFEAQDRWQPDRSFRLTPATATAPDAPWPAPPGPRPLLLLRWPEPVDVEAGKDDLAAPTALRRHGRRGNWRPLVHAAGPERIAPDWRARDPNWPAARDYWRVAEAAGPRLWLYRDSGRWFLHGFFA